MQSVFDLAPLLKKQCLDLSELFRDGNSPKGQATFAEFLDGTHWLVNVIQLLKGQLQEKGLKDETLKAWETAHLEFQAVIKELLSSFEDQDFVLMSDILEYDLSTSLDQWFDVLNSGVKILDK